MNDLAAAFAGLVRHQVARADTPLAQRPGIDWIWAANGIFKRGMDATLVLQGRITHLEHATVPGLDALLPFVQWAACPGRLPGAHLGPLLRDAQQAGAAAGQAELVRPIEKQYFFVERDGIRLVAPHVQQGTAASLRYTMPVSGTPLLDLHSHHTMRAYFSTTDDRDDSGLSVSAVIGQIYTKPEIVVRLNIYGHHCPIPALMIFDSLGPFVDRYAGGSDARPSD